MAVAISPIRTFLFKSKIEEVSVTFTFKGEEDAYRNFGETGSNALHRLLRSSIVEATGFNDLEGKPLPEMTEEIQMGIFSWILTEDDELFSEILTKYAGLTEKKSKSGVPQQVTGTGDQETVTFVN